MIMDTYSDNNCAPPDIPDESAGSSVSSRFQDEYEELLKYAVVVPKLDVDDLPRVLADSKRQITMHKQPTPPQDVLSSDSDEEEDRGERSAPQLVTVKQGLGRIISPARKQPNTEADIETVTPKTVVSPSQRRVRVQDRSVYSHKPRPGVVDTDSDSELVYSHKYNMAGAQLNNNAAASDDEEKEESGDVMFERTVTSERAPSETDVREIERKLDMWSRQLNSNVMDEICRLRIKLIETSRHHIQTSQSRHCGEMNTLHAELEGMKELLHTYEISIERKDGVISNLTRSLQNQKEKFDTLKNFTDWKLQYAAKKQEGYGMRLAAQHHNRTMKRRCWRMWHMIIVEKWRRRVEKACQAKAQEVCISLTNDYEAKLQSLDEKYSASRDEVMTLHRERDFYEENMKKAFMRGVCALNMEAMNMFHEPEPPQLQQQQGTDDGPPSLPQSRTAQQYHSDGENYPPTDTQSMPQYRGGMFGAASPLVGAQSYTIQHAPAYTTTAEGHGGHLKQSRSESFMRGKKMTATVTASTRDKPTIGKPGTARLMSQQPILIERHDSNLPTHQKSEEITLTKPRGSSRIVKVVK